ncbi:MAG: tRNA 2-thiouridine(34) synthase MnmA [Anaerolineaceae bacterium]|nr:tRNA 2-thiouridine(34) synthase MnmA [Anaerolineaceae bacterium]
MHNKLIYVGLSGGVDSAVSALLLKQQGYQVRGIHLRLWEPETEPGSEDVIKAARVAEQLQIPFEVMDWREKFRSEVVETYIQVLGRGQTPNPCIHCNQTIKWGALWEQVHASGADYLASGHYARLLAGQQGVELHKAINLAKDQSYFLAMLTRQTFRHMLLPLGGFAKPQVRAIAAEAGLEVASRKDSEDLCFLKGLDQEGFLRRYAPHLLQPGPILDGSGNLLGEHRGLPLYTIGQRKGICVAAEAPLYVMAKDLAANALRVGRADELAHSKILAGRPNWISGKAPDLGKIYQVKIRAAALPASASLQILASGDIIASLEKPLRDITAGQYLAVYDGDCCLGSAAIIEPR